MFESLALIHGALDAIRLSTSRDKVAALLEMGVDRADIDEGIKYYGDLDASPEAHLRWIFDEGGQGKSDPTRFTDGSLPVLYTALDLSTATAEMAHWLSPLPGVSVYFRSLTVAFLGKYKDLNQAESLPTFLTGQQEDGCYVDCLGVSREALRESLDAFKTPSARYLQGVCFPILSKASIRALVPTGYLRFTFDLESGAWRSKVV